MPNVIQHIDHRGRDTFQRRFERLNINGQSRVVAAIAMMRRNALSDVRHIASGVWERRIDSGPGYRIYFGWEQGDIILLLVGTKDGQGNLNRGDIARAVQLWNRRREQRRN